MSLAAIPILGAVLAIPGIRLVMLWSRTRLAPEGLLAVFFLGFAFGIPIRLYLTGNTALSPWSLELWSGVALTMLISAVSAMVLFTRAVFRPASKLALVCSWAALAFDWSCVGILVWQGALSEQVHPAALSANFAALPIFWWAFVECVIQLRKMRRQAELGMGDALVRNRFLLWTLWTGVFAILPSFVLGLKLVLIAMTPEGEAISAPPGLMAFVRGFVLACSVTAATSIWLSFFPPAFYVARLHEGRAYAGADL